MCEIILISGKARSGKDTTADFIREQLENRGLSVLKINYADYLKFVCSKYLGCSQEKNQATRNMWQYIGTDVIRANDPDFLVRTVVDLVKALEPAGLFDVVIVPDLRFPNEVDYWQQRGYEVDTIRVIRKDYESELTASQKAHPSETSLDDYSFDYVFIAKDLDELRQICQKYVDLKYCSNRPD